MFVKKMIRSHLHNHLVKGPGTDARRKRFPHFKEGATAEDEVQQVDAARSSVKQFASISTWEDLMLNEAQVPVFIPEGTTVPQRRSWLLSCCTILDHVMESQPILQNVWHRIHSG